MIKYREEIGNCTPYVPGRPIEDVKKEYGLKTAVKLASNENPIGCSEQAKKAVIEALEDVSLYPDGNCTALRERLAQKYNVLPTQIVFGCGADEIIMMIGKVFVNNGDECITGAASFSTYTASGLSMGGKMVYSPMKNNGFDLDDILARITDKTKVIFIANPNNPTGNAFTQAEQEAFMAKVPGHVLVVLDEAYSDFVEDENYPKTLDMLKQYPNIFYMRTFSKVYGLASMRVGFAIASEEIVTLFEKIRNAFNVSVPAQAAAIASLGDGEFLAKSIAANARARQYTQDEFTKMGLSFIPSQANFVMVDVKKDSREMFVELMKRGYIIRPGAAFGMDNYLRVSLGTMEQMKGFINTLKELI